MATLGNISLVFLGLMTGLVRCEISSCYKVGPAPEYSRMFYSSHSEVDQSWINSTVLDLVQPVMDYEECQLLCQVRKTTLHYNSDQSRIENPGESGLIFRIVKL